MKPGSGAGNSWVDSPVKSEGFKSGAKCTLIYVNCADCAEQGSRFVTAGGRIQRDRMAID